MLLGGLAEMEEGRLSGRSWSDARLLWPLMFAQFQCAGARLLFAQGLRLSLR